MKYLKKLTPLLLITFSLSSYAKEPKIEAFQAAFYVGQNVMACGNLVQIKHLNNRHYLNIDKSFPNQSLTILIWDKDYRWFESKFGNIDLMISKRFCARGKIEEYKNNLQMEIKNPQFLRLMR